MKFEFDTLGLIKYPKISIHRIDLAMIGYLNVFNIVLKPTFCNISELTFKCYKGSEHYNCLKKDMVLEVADFGRYIITNVDENDNGEVCYAEVTAHSWEETLNKVTISYTDNSYMKLWDAIDPEAGSYVRQPDGSMAQYPTLLYIIQQQTGWTIKHVDADLLNSYRTLSIDKEQVYGFLMGTVADTFKCFFEFDTFNKWIYCYSKDENTYEPINTGINFSFRNLIKEQRISEGSEEIITALTIKGAEGVGISLVNPLGNDVLYDFSYYMNDEEWGMPADLQEAVQDWMNLIDVRQTTYQNAVTAYRTCTANILTLNSEKSVLESELLALQDVQAVSIAANDDAGLAQVYPLIQSKENAIKGKELDIQYQETAKAGHLANMQSIVQELSFANNFTSAQLEQLQYYINGSVYENGNFVFTQDMPDCDKIDTEKDLYEFGLQTFKKLSSPMYEYTCSIDPFMFSQEYNEFTKNIKLGGAVNLELKSGKWVTPKLMQLIIDYDEPENTTAILSDSFRLLDGISQFSNGFNQAIKASRKTSTAAPLWDEPLNNGFYGTVTEYINNALNLANQEIINADNQEFKLGSYGLRGKMWDETQGDYDPHQVAMTNNVLAFTDDNWQSCRMALGRVTIGQNEYYGVVAEAIVGELIAGTQMTIRDANSSFVIDGSGVNLENAPFTVYNSTSRILINPTDGFKIQKKNGNVWDTVLSEDNSGNIVANSITLQTGYIGGWEIKSDGLYSPTGDYIKTNGTGKLSLLTYTNNTATFAGDIYANNLKWNYGSGTPSNIFTVSSGIPGMAGSWLTAGSVGIDRRNAAQWDDLYAQRIWCEDLFAERATIAELKAGYIDAEGVRTDLIFGGQYYVGMADTPSNRTTMYAHTENISAQYQNIYSLYVLANGNIRLNPDVGAVIVGGTGALSASNITASTKLTASSLLEATDATITDELTAHSLSVDTTATISNNNNTGTLITDWIQLRQKLDHLTVSDSFNVECNATFERDVTAHNSDGTATMIADWIQVRNKINKVIVSNEFKTDTGIDATIGGRLWIAGGTAVQPGGSGSFWHGRTADITIDGVTLYFKDGLLI